MLKELLSLASFFHFNVHKCLTVTLRISQRKQQHFLMRIVNKRLMNCLLLGCTWRIKKRICQRADQSPDDPWPKPEYLTREYWILHNVNRINDALRLSS